MKLKIAICFIGLCASIPSYSNQINDDKALFCSAKDKNGELVNPSNVFSRPEDHSHCKKGNIITAQLTTYQLLCDFSKPVHILSQKGLASCVYRGKIRDDQAYIGK